MNKESIEAFIQQATRLMPDDLSRFQTEIEDNLRATLNATFAKMDLVTRAEFDIQTALLQRTRAQLEVLLTKITALEDQLNDKNNE